MTCFYLPVGCFDLPVGCIGGPVVLLPRTRGPLRRNHGPASTEARPPRQTHNPLRRTHRLLRPVRDPPRQNHRPLQLCSKRASNVVNIANGFFMLKYRNVLNRTFLRERSSFGHFLHALYPTMPHSRPVLNKQRRRRAKREHTKHKRAKRTHAERKHTKHKHTKRKHTERKRTRHRHAGQPRNDNRSRSSVARSLSPASAGTPRRK